ncbi:recombination regulator RecX [Clostridium algidicarnis]|uniref:recombination regulator RecX n=1 Tax=Clostridium algidicarnis TaxID=37659 RepID=UPI0016235DD0|nr:recombination regulator RecX [Clostridium algidicarnis]MBB6697664.1 recombination regulator RecX [Clostridium algidicarnis]MBU3192938.1 recombination regulator RecX [Clostridium algidicarnis]MBU3203460.1 recombination regulator RecX [Clostridium algidicarnis]MBU3206216.1 recombination regulator RecX [Clostridium algidicarnis]MBU3211614.1 recombination regulator RecX [Clostridium algidicarnis]
MEGKITSIQVQSRNKDRVNIFVDEEFALACFAEVVYKQNIKKGDRINLEQLNEILFKEEFSKAKNYALRLVEKGLKPEKAVRDKLFKKEYSKETIDKVIEFLKDYTLIDDKRYAQGYAKEKIKSNGKNKIKYGLLSKGIKKDVIEVVLEDIYDEDKDREIAEKIAVKKFNLISKRETDKYKIKGKLYQFLIGKGYSSECIKFVIEKIFKDNSL